MATDRATDRPRPPVASLRGAVVDLDLPEGLDLVPAVGEGRRPVEHLTRLLSAAAESSPHRVAVPDTVAAPMEFSTKSRWEAGISRCPRRQRILQGLEGRTRGDDYVVALDIAIP